MTRNSWVSSRTNRVEQYSFASGAVLAGRSRSAQLGKLRRPAACTAVAGRRSGKTWRRPSATRTPWLSWHRFMWTACRRNLPRPSSARSRPVPGGQAVCAVVNCGFAEVLENDVALEIYRLFARDAGLHGGGLAIGCGGMFAGKPLTEQGGKARHITAAFDQAVAALDADQDIPESATTGIRKQAIPTWAYFAMANLSMLIAAAKNGSLLKIGAAVSCGKKTPARSPQSTANCKGTIKSLTERWLAGQCSETAVPTKKVLAFSRLGGKRVRGHRRTVRLGVDGEQPPPAPVASRSGLPLEVDFHGIAGVGQHFNQCLRT